MWFQAHAAQDTFCTPPLDPVRPFKTSIMNNMFRGLFAGAAAYKWGGGCLGTVLVFILVYMLLGHC
jgi:hypothetical protein